MLSLLLHFKGKRSRKLSDAEEEVEGRDDGDGGGKVSLFISL